MPILWESSQSHHSAPEFENIKEFPGWVFQCLFAQLLQQFQSDFSTSLTKPHAGFLSRGIRLPKSFWAEHGGKTREHKSQAWICGCPWFEDQKEQLSL